MQSKQYLLDFPLSWVTFWVTIVALRAVHIVETALQNLFAASTQLSD
jgi:hypothetical protein